MPVANMQFENGVFFAKGYGYVNKKDVEIWARSLHEYASSSVTPIVALLDALDVSFMSASARMIFADASRTPNLRVIAVAARDLLTIQTVRVTGILGEPGRTQVFLTLNEARRFANEQAVGTAKRRVLQA